MKKYVYSFMDGNKNMRNILGGKGANLAEMINLGIRVPKGFTVSTEACNKYYENKETITDSIKHQILIELVRLEKQTGKKFGDEKNPLLVSVRSGARVSMPGMMDTILNLGLNDKVVETLANLTDNKRFAYDCYRRLIMMFSDVVMGYSKDHFERELDKIKEKKKIKSDLELTSDDMVEITNKFKDIYLKGNGKEFPQDSKVQLFLAVEGVFKSWNTDRAIIYRKINNIPSTWGTAVNVQQMVYGNMGEDSGTGVAFTRNPSTGEKKLYGEFLINAQGEDVVAGIRTPKDIASLKEIMPNVYKEFTEVCKTLEKHYRDMQDMEFTIEKGKLYMLQTRNGKRTAEAAVKIAVDLVEEKMINKKEAILRVEPTQLDQLLHPTFNPDSLKKAKEFTKGLGASPGAAYGKIYFNADDILAHKKEETILVRLETSPEDIEGMQIAKGIMTVRGGMTSHAAVVARGMGRCCICGCEDLVVDYKKKMVTNGKITLKEGDYISLDGSTGSVYVDTIETVAPEIKGNFKTFMNWVNKYRELGVRVNADTPKDARTALSFGAEGIGLCRTEHMFFDEKRIFNFRKMILAETTEEREAALKKILPYQRDDFEQLFEIMAGKEVTIRYLDPPLHEFLPKEKKDIEELAKSLNIKVSELNNRIAYLKEANPMMGHRGCRLAITYPEILVMQTNAIMDAAIKVRKTGLLVEPELMIPLISDIREFRYLKHIIVETIDKKLKEENIKIPYKIGTMIELPRAALIADQIAKEADFFSFGTNDLTQMTYGFSRDDASKFLEDYYEKGIFDKDPFTHIDEEGVGGLVELATRKGRSRNPKLQLGICGEQGGDPATDEFCHRVGLNYVSCSAYRIPIAMLALAQAKVKER